MMGILPSRNLSKGTSISSNQYMSISYAPGYSLVAQMVKNLPAMQETWVQSPFGEDSLEKGMTIHSIILAWRIPWTEEPDGWSVPPGWSMGYKELDMTEQITLTRSTALRTRHLRSENGTQAKHFFLEWNSQTGGRV